MSDRKILFIVEGNKDEPSLINRIFELTDKNQKPSIYCYNTTLHTFADRLEKNYPDFDDGNTDIQLVLRGGENNEKEREKLSQSYNDIFLIFDFEPQHHKLHFETIRKMLEYYNDSSFEGKLYINYPMIQSYKHFDKLPDDSYKDLSVTIEQCKNYKYLVERVSKFTNLEKYNYEVLMMIITHNLKKANFISNNKYSLLSNEEYLSFDCVSVFDKQLENKGAGFVYVLNTCVFIYVDYNPTVFFKQAHKLGLDK